jgi:hypothetical protein
MSSFDDVLSLQLRVKNNVLMRDKFSEISQFLAYPLGLILVCLTVSITVKKLPLVAGIAQLSH